MQIREIPQIDAYIRKWVSSPLLSYMQTTMYFKTKVHIAGLKGFS